MRRWLANALRGVCMGAADVVPGVSGGTMALVLGIYPRLIDALSGLGPALLRRIGTRAFWSALRAGALKPRTLDDAEAGPDAGRVLFLASLGAGILPAIAVAARVLPPLLESHPAHLRGLFLGLVLASVAVPLRAMERRGSAQWAAAALAAVATAWLVGLGASGLGAATGGAGDPSLAYLLLGGMLAISAMALPGISGAFVLVLLGLYDHVLRTLSLAIYERDPEAMLVIAALAAAMLAGLLTFVRLLKLLLARWRDGTLAVLAGLLVGSLRMLWPFVREGAGGAEVAVLPGSADAETVEVALLFLAGAGAVLLLHAAGVKRAADRGR